MEQRRLMLTGLTVALLTSITGCGGGSSDPPRPDRENAVLRDSLARQAELNKAILQQNREVIEASRKLVEADAQSRKEFIVLQQAIQQERSALVHQQDLIDAERKQLAQERHRDPILAAAITNAALLVAVAVTLAFCWFLLKRLGMDSDTETMRDLLVTEVISGRPFLLPGPSAPLAPPPLPAPDREPKALTE